MDLLLKGLRWQMGNQMLEGDIRIKNGFIANIDYSITPQNREPILRFDTHYIYPGLINSHDHLEMNLYPRMGNPPYGNYTEWGRDIYKPTEFPIKEIEKVSIEDRLLWGGIKNLISGATTVVHHNPWHRLLSSQKFPVQVLKKFAWSHSLAFGKDIKKSFLENPRVPFIIHAAEGIDELASGEIKKLNEFGLLKSNTVLVHAISLTDQDVEKIAAASTSVIWCPSSNFFLFNQTTPIEKLKSKVKLAIGSDSALTGPATLLDEMQIAFQTGLVTAEYVFNQATSIPAKIFNLREPDIAIGSPADLLILPINHHNYFENLLCSSASKMELVTISGEPRYCGETVAKDLGLKKYFAQVGGILKWFYFDVRNLKDRLRKEVGKAADENLLWKMLE